MAYVLVIIVFILAICGILDIFSPAINHVQKERDNARNERIANGTATASDIEHNSRVIQQQRAVFGGIDPTTPKTSNLPVNMTSRVFTVRLEAAIDCLDAHCNTYTQYVVSLANLYRCTITSANRGITAYCNPLDNCVAAFTTVTYTACGDWNDNVARAFLSNISASTLEQWSRIR